MKKLVAVTYQFIFPPADTWSNLYELDKSLSDFFAAHGLEAEVIKPIEGAPGGRTLFIGKIELMPGPQAPTPDERRKQPGSQLKDMAERKLRAPALAFKAHK